jgi:mannitol/fructose-specific phosphotransferase system IIA component (Ntr-type)
MKLLDYISPNSLLPRQELGSKNEVVDRLLAGLARDGAITSPQNVAAEILRREIQAGTAIGGGLAVPHARSVQVDRLLIAVATLSRPLPIPSEDGQPVDVFVLIISPDKDQRPMLRALARLARLVKDGDLLRELRQARTPEAMQAAFAHAEALLDQPG